MEVNADLHKLVLIYELNTKKEKSHVKLVTLVRETMEILNIDMCTSRMIIYAAHTENIKV